MQKEIWRDIDNYYIFYEISNFGNVRNKQTKYVLKQQLNSSGYLGVTLSHYRVKRLVHRLVGQAFIPNPENKPQINHKDSNKTNNKVENLKWLTAKENSLHSLKYGLGRDCLRKNKYGRLNKNQILEILEYSKKGKKQQEIADIFKINHSMVSQILSGKRWGWLTDKNHYLYELHNDL